MGIEELNALGVVHLLEASQFVEYQKISEIFIWVEVVLQRFKGLALCFRLLVSRSGRLIGVHAQLRWINRVLLVEARSDLFDLVLLRVVNQYLSINRASIN